MSKKSQLRKREARARERARELTFGKMLRLLLKSLAFAVLVTMALVLLEFLGVPGMDNRWLQIGLMVAVYLLAYPVLMREFRPSTYLRDAPSENDA